MDSIYFESMCVPAHVITFHELLETYFAKRRKPHCRSDHNNIKRAFRLLTELFPNIDTGTFDAEHVEEFQNLLIRMRYDRKHINKQVGFVKSILKWATTKKLVSPILNYAIQQVPPLKEGEALKENPDREDAKPEDIEAVLNHLPIQIAHMLALQALTGLRPSEICNLKAADIDQNLEDILQGTYWRYQPAKHKTSGKGVKRGLALGEFEQAILKLYLTDDPEKPLFRNLKKYKDRVIARATYSREINKAINTQTTQICPLPGPAHGLYLDQ